ncbi:MAG: putative lipoprotein transrane [Polaromonas sp.]|nr:putative lipoprotein transrane [Polaromonas sp.]
MLKQFFGAAACAALVAGCTTPPPPGAPREAVVQRYGNPTSVVTLPTGTRMQYSRQPAGQSVVNVDLDASGRVVSTRQALTPDNFLRIGSEAPGKWTRADVERELGRPARVDRVGSWRGDIMTYRWLDATQQDMLFYVYLDPGNTVQRTGQGMEIRTWGDPDR